MQSTLLTNQKKKSRTSRGKLRKGLDSVEENMNYIQDSLSMSHHKPSKQENHFRSEPRIVSSFKDDSEMFDGFTSSPSWEELLSDRKRQIKKKKDDIKRLQDDG